MGTGKGKRNTKDSVYCLKQIDSLSGSHLCRLERDSFSFYVGLEKKKCFRMKYVYRPGYTRSILLPLKGSNILVFFARELERGIVNFKIYWKEKSEFGGP